MRILVVDDDPDVRSLIERTAPPWLEVVGASSSREALACLKDIGAARPDLALIDIHLPAHLGNHSEHEGLALASWIVGGPVRTPVCLISSHPFPAPPEGGPGPTVLGRLRKPLDLTRLHRFLSAWEELFATHPEAGLRDPGASSVG